MATGHPHHRGKQGNLSRRVEEVVRALGDRAEDPEAVQVVSVLVDPGFRGTLISTGISPERATEVAARLAIDWLERSGS